MLYLLNMPDSAIFLHFCIRMGPGVNMSNLDLPARAGGNYIYETYGTRVLCARFKVTVIVDLVVCA